jgi:hypothetical protein
VEQLSLPYRIALVGILAVGALYLLVLKPKDDTGTTAAAPAAATTTSTGTTAPGVKGLSTAVDKAKGAAAAQSSSDAATQAATGGAATAAPSAAAKPGATAATTTVTPAKTPAATAAKPTSAAAKPAKPAAPSGDPSKPILAELDRGHTAVVLFAGKTAKDDRAVRRAVQAVDRHDGKVDVHVIPLTRVGRYEAITRGVAVRQSPTVLVISKQRAARTIVGFTTVAELNQLVSDVRRGF